MREIAPQAEQIFRDQYVFEFIGGKEYEHENTMKKAKRIKHVGPTKGGHWEIITE